MADITYMLYLKDKTDLVWSTLSDDGETIYYDDDTSVPFSLDHLIVTFWAKYKGKKLTDVSDVKDLRFLLKVAGEKSDDFAAKYVNMRLLEVTQ